MNKTTLKNTASIKEIFSSIQGEGLETGKKHIFVRFTRCNLNCAFCDTDFKSSAKTYDIKKLYKELSKFDCDTISFTGGEPLIEWEFLKEFLKTYKQKLNKKIYLETNGTMSEQLKKIIRYVDIVAMDIKIESATGQKNNFRQNLEFLKIASLKEAFIKVVFDKNIKQKEINEILKIASGYNTKIILHPKMPMESDIDLIKIYDKFYKKYKNVYLIAQNHKFLNLA